MHIDHNEISPPAFCGLKLSNTHLPPPPRRSKPTACRRVIQRTALMFEAANCSCLPRVLHSSTAPTPSTAPSPPPAAPGALSPFLRSTLGQSVNLATRKMVRDNELVVECLSGHRARVVALEPAFDRHPLVGHAVGSDNRVLHQRLPPAACCCCGGSGSGCGGGGGGGCGGPISPTRLSVSASAVWQGGRGSSAGGAAEESECPVEEPDAVRWRAASACACVCFCACASRLPSSSRCVSASSCRASASASRRASASFVAWSSRRASASFVAWSASRLAASASRLVSASRRSLASASRLRCASSACAARLRSSSLASRCVASVAF
eukprot:scaffold77108_cov64-Phaeocystis_antarctica.AAC.2